MFRSENIVINGNKLTFEVCEPNSFEITHKVEFRIKEVKDQNDTTSYILQSYKDSLWSIYMFVKKKDNFYEIHQPVNCFSNKEELINEMNLHPLNLTYFSDGMCYSNTLPNRDTKDENLFGEYYDLSNNHYVISTSKIHASLNEINDLTGDEFIKEIEYEIIEKQPFGHWFYYILKNDSNYQHLFYRIKTNNIIAFHLDPHSYENLEELNEYLNLWKEKERVPVTPGCMFKVN